jgi:hypothetical protein
LVTTKFRCSLILFQVGNQRPEVRVVECFCERVKAFLKIIDKGELLLCSSSPFEKGFVIGVDFEAFFVGV